MKRALAANVPQTGFHFDDKTHHYFYDGKPMTGCTTILGVLAKPALVPWAARMAVEYIKEHAPLIETATPKYYEVDEPTLEAARSAHAKKRDTAADAGTDLHAEIEEMVYWTIKMNDGTFKNYPVDLRRQHSPNALYFIDWAIKENIRFIATEQRLYSKELWVAGTCDLIFEKDGKRYVGDIKTYKKIWDRVPLIQCAGYALMWEEMNTVERDVMVGPVMGNGARACERRSVIDQPIDGYCVICLPKERTFNEVDDVLWSHDTEGDKAAFESCVRLYRYLNQK